ncbi:hypothetical protein [Limnohabitans sp.]|uniref:hypothetical protein n=1 Tax=Limnohabitans sp. TaxID=1907725 RepID=UPI0037C1A442
MRDHLDFWKLRHFFQKPLTDGQFEQLANQHKILGNGGGAQSMLGQARNKSIQIDVGDLGGGMYLKNGSTWASSLFFWMPTEEALNSSRETRSHSRSNNVSASAVKLFFFSNAPWSETLSTFGAILAGAGCASGS